MAQGVAGCRLVQARSSNCFPHHPLDRLFVQMVTSPNPGARIARGECGGKKVLPAEVEMRAREFAVQRMRQLHATETRFRRGVVKFPETRQANAQWCEQGLRQHG